jgi:ABC-type transporter Mla subunit MlaD
LLSAQQDAAGAQRDAIDTLIRTSSETLSQVSDTFSQQVSDQASQLNQVAGDVAGSAAEVASLSDAFATAVQVFSRANDTLLDNLQQVESSLEKSSARADEQLGYYVEQAREVIELSMASQKEVIDALANLRHGDAPAHNGQRSVSGVN